MIFFFDLIIGDSINCDSIFWVSDSSTKTKLDNVKTDSLFIRELFSIKFSKFEFSFSWFSNNSFNFDSNLGVRGLS